MSDKAIFLDRDDTLIEDPGYINDPDQVKLIDGAPEALNEFRKMGYKLIVVSNQSGVARGIFTEKVLGQIHDRLNQLLAENSTRLDKIYYCPYHPEGVVAKYCKESDDRKPNPGMLLKAADEMDIDLSKSWMIGNSPRDIEAGQKAGCKTILIDNSTHTKKLEPIKPLPDYKAVNIKEAVNIIKKLARSSTKQIGINPQQKIKKEPAEKHTQIEQDTEKMDEKTNSDYNQADRTEQLLTDILEQLKNIHRGELFGEFSIMRLLAGAVQIFVPFCLLISIWFLMSPTDEHNSVFIAIGFAVVLQLMALTFYIMQGRK